MIIQDDDDNGDDDDNNDNFDYGNSDHDDDYCR